MAAGTDEGRLPRKKVSLLPSHLKCIREMGERRRRKMVVAKVDQVNRGRSVRRFDLIGGGNAQVD